MERYWFGSLQNHELTARLDAAVARDRSTTVELLALLGEVEARKLHRPAGYGSMFEYCLGALHMSEDVAYKRLRTARAARRWPVILEMIEDGRLHVSGVTLLTKHLTAENAQELLAASVHRTRRQVEVLLAERFPQEDVPTRFEPVMGSNGSPATPGTSAAAMDPAATSIEPGADLLAAAVGAAEATVGADSSAVLPVPGRVGPIESTDSAQSMEPLSARARVAPLSKGRYAFQLTVDQEFHDLLRYAQALFGHAVPDGATLEVLKRALRAVIAQEERRKFGVGARLRTVTDPKDPRYVSPKDRCEVFVRDEGGCTFEGEGGHRCGSRTRLQFHHRKTFARGGPATADNLTLHCAAHDQLQAERDYGEGFMREKREAARARKESRIAGRVAVPDADSATVVAVRSARARGQSPADVLGSRAAAEEARARLDAMLAESARPVVDRGNPACAGTQAGGAGG